MTADARGRANRRRGVEWERAVVAWLRRAGIPAERTPTGRHADVGDVDGLLGLLVECKHAQRHELGPWLDTARAKAAGTGRSALLVVKRRRHPDPGDAYAVLTLRDLLALTRPPLDSDPTR